MKAENSSNRIVISSRVRLARNLRGSAFPGWAKKADRQQVLDLLQPAVEATSEMKELSISKSMDGLSALEKQLLVERHLVSREHAAKNVGSGVVINKSESVSVMINEEDHLRMQAIRPGLQLPKAHQIIDKLDSELEGKVEYAFSPRLGYLTACPTNVGTGMRASAMLHLPGLVLHEQVNQIIQAVNKLGLAVRGLHGEGTEALGNVFQVSNQSTLGERETNVVERLNKVICQIIEHEENARLSLLDKKPHMIYDQVGRAYGILTSAHAMSSKESMNLLSMMRMGVDLDILPGLDRALIDDLFIATQPAHLQKTATEKLSAEERDVLRAEIVRTALKGIQRPKEHRPRRDSSKEGKSNE
jgi:protein arginine kinase